MAETLQTARLLLRPFVPADADALHAQWNDPDVGRWLWDAEPVSRETVDAVIASSQASFRERGYGMFTLRPREARDEVIGFAGLRTIGESSDVEILYALLPARWGRGLATEAARAVLEWGFGTLGLAAIAAGADPPNAASFAVMERLAMPFWKEIVLNGRPARYHRLTVSDHPSA
jgi:[ribosomal protein S5]-alanine N-acetyltransferase